MSIFTNPLIRLTVGTTDIVIGALTIYDPEWAIHELGGMTLPYYFEDQYDDQTYETWDGYGDLEENEELTHE